jgi:hypothetical protein
MADDTQSPPTNEQADDLFAIRVHVTPERAGELLQRGDIDFGDRPHIRPNPDGTGILELFATRGQVADLEAQGHQLEVGENVSAHARERVAEVGQGDRFEGGRTPPRGLGRKVGGHGAEPPDGAS